MRRPTLILFVKEPIAGRVKTRLGRDIGMSAAAWWFRHHSAALIRRLAADRRWRTVLAVAPDTAISSRAWPAHLPRMAQGSGELGARMVRALEACRPSPGVLIGADIPGVTRHHIARAFAALGDHDAVFGPAEDGGYWLVGLSGRQAPPPGFLQDIAWSGPHALAQSRESLPTGWRVALIDRLQDVDTADDLARLSGS